MSPYQHAFLSLTICASGLAFSCSDGDGSSSSDSEAGGASSVGQCRGIETCADASGPGGAGGAASCEPSDLRLEFRPFALGDAHGVTDFKFLPGKSGKFLLTAQEGRIHLGQISGENLSISNSWTIPDDVYNHSACGLTNVLLDPEFDEEGFIYVSYCTSETNTRLVRYTWSEGAGLGDQAIIFETNLKKPTDNWHRFGSMGFESDGETLWMLVGDHFDSKNGQDGTTPMGSVVRIKPSRKAGKSGYSPASGNMGSLPDVTANADVFAKGLRSPWRGTRDSLGRIWIGDVGLGRFEEVNLLTEVGQNFGWDLQEGPCVGDCAGFSDPLTYYGRASDEPYVLDDPDTTAAVKRAIWVGDSYEDVAVDRYCGLMNGMVVFGDLFTGWVRGLRADASGKLRYDESIGHLESVTAFRHAPDGYNYALTLDGSLHRAILAGAED